MNDSRTSRYLFGLMFAIVCLISINFAILRGLRNTLAVTDLGGSAMSIPYFELLGAMPGSVLMVAILAWSLNRLSLQGTFTCTLGAFLAFFVAFAFVIYPIFKCSSGMWGQVLSMVFYVMAELWKVALLTILFWGLVNQYMPLDGAKRLYAPLTLAGSVGTLIAGPITSCMASSYAYLPLFGDPWRQTLTLLLLTVVLFGVIAGVLYYLLWHSLSTTEPAPVKSEEISLRSSLSTCNSSPPLLLLAFTVVADYVAYTLGEVIFLDALKERYPLSQDYCRWMGHLSLWSGLLTVVSAIWIAPIVLQRCRWEVAALATPICVLITEGAFFIVLRLPEASQRLFAWNHLDWLQVLVWLGSLQYCLCRAVKYTLFDSSRELVFLMLPQSDRIPGKLVVDGMCARIGRGGASFISLALAQVFGGVLASAWVAGPLALGVAGTWVAATCRLGSLFRPSNPILSER